ncbi:hypothetical protein H70357_11710 [Paenibacillus sp. FSL H7-0357]|uniref:hypothetical protein n=1 Tax=Paenibacillus sp. FSL H7-0357 TaxID=1536774 RepID=UPI0004F90A47|nr:hypothetical protein [Paenibacillus sp. FSL H7-0357]AIQ17247.1 hypothetical protein H70357_11710 [Paenibacillus sp. FSL H7-0357]
MKEIIVSQELLNEFENIQWFTNCGKQAEIDLLCSVQQVDGWEKAEEFDEKDEWEEVISKSRDNLADFIMRKLGYSVRNFNSIVAAVRESQQYKTAIAKLYDSVEERNIKEEFGDTLSWLLLNAGIERAFAGFKGCPKFFSEMLEVLKLGHCPCGWMGRWPKGTLYIY